MQYRLQIVLHVPRKTLKWEKKLLRMYISAQPAKGLVEGMKNRHPKYAAVRGRLFIVLLL